MQSRDNRRHEGVMQYLNITGVLRLAYNEEANIVQHVLTLLM